MGQIVAVSGTAPIAADGSVACPGDVYGQTRRCVEIIGDAVVDAGLSLDTVVRTRIKLTDVSQWEAAARAHGEFFAAIRPATTFVEVKGDDVLLPLRLLMITATQRLSRITTGLCAAMTCV